MVNIKYSGRQYVSRARRCWLINVLNNKKAIAPARKTKSKSGIIVRFQISNGLWNAQTALSWILVVVTKGLKFPSEQSMCHMEDFLLT